MAYFPFFVELSGKNGVIIGGGHVALRKVQKLLPYGPALTVIASDFIPELKQLAEDETQQITLLYQVLSSDTFPAVCPSPSSDHFPLTDDIPAFVITAADDRELNHRISAFCRQRHIPVNAVDDHDACSFLFPALVQDGELSVGICTGGASPSAAIYIKEQLQSLLPERFGEILSWLASVREPIKQQIPDEKQRSRCFSQLFTACLKNGRPLKEHELQELQHMVNAEKTGCVYLIGAGCGEADLITVKGMKLLSRCDAVVYDDLIHDELLDYAPQTAERIYMGKRSGRHSASQEEISAALISLAREGKTVARLKGGDPFLFGRGGEEMLALRSAGIPCEEVPGVTSAIAIPASAGIPATHRGVSRSVHIVTAHTADTPDGLPADLDRLAQLSGTLVFLMGLTQLPRITGRLIAAGMAPDTPAAVISSGMPVRPFTVRGALADIAELSQKAQVLPPAVIVVGDVAAMDLNSAPNLHDTDAE